MDKEKELFILRAIEKLTWALLTGVHESGSIEKIMNQARDYINELEMDKNEQEDK